jgi:hypothetical protein
MEYRSVRWIGLAILIVLGFMALQPYIHDRLYSASTPRPVEPSGSLSDYEKSTIEIFQRWCRWWVRSAAVGSGRSAGRRQKFIPPAA